MTAAKLTVDDIADARAYEREREDFRSRIIAVKKIRRVAIGPVVTLVFESRDTIRFQIQEMARAERLYTDEAIQTELDTYNPLIPDSSSLSATLFIELTSRAEMEHWLPRLVGIERAIGLELGRGDSADLVRGEVEADHAAHLTREEMTAAVHFLHFPLTAMQIERMSQDDMALVSHHPEYQERAELSEETRASLMSDLLG
jgi:Protein of unknown function (DUF3501)